MKQIILFYLSLFIVSCYLAPLAPPSANNLPSIGNQGNIINGGTNPNGNSTEQNSLPPPTAPQTTGQGSSRTNELPYNFIPDVMSTLTCGQNVNFDNRGPYTLSLGSYYEGVQLSDSFKTANNLSKRTSRTVSQNEKERIKQALRNSPLKVAQAELSIRDRGNVYQTIQSNSYPLKNYFHGFNTNYIVEQLSSLSPALSTRPINSSKYNSSPFRSRLLNLTNHDFVSGIAPNLSNESGEYMLALLYTVNQGQQQIPISNANQRPYGKTYTISFNNNLNINYPVDIHEEDLQSSKKGKEWECVPDMRFMIHKNDNPKASNYNKGTASFSQYKSTFKKLNLEGYCDLNYYIDEVLTKDQIGFLSLEFGGVNKNNHNWPFKVGKTVVARNEQYVSLDTPCIVIPPSKGSCYPTGFYRIEFDPEQVHNCVSAHNATTDLSNEYSDIYKICPAWLSICYRTP